MTEDIVPQLWSHYHLLYISKLLAGKDENLSRCRQLCAQTCISAPWQHEIRACTNELPGTYTIQADITQYSNDTSPVLAALEVCYVE